MTGVYKTMNCQIIWKSRGVQELSGKSLHAFHQILTGVWDPKEAYQKSWPSRKQNSPYIHPFTSVTVLHWNLLLLLNFIAPTKAEVYSQHQSIKPVTFSLYSHLKELPWLKSSPNNRTRNHIWLVLVKNSEQTLKPCNHSGLEDSFPGTVLFYPGTWEICETGSGGERMGKGREVMFAPPLRGQSWASGVK